MEQFRGENRLLRPMIYLKSRRRLLRRRRAQARARGALANGTNGDPVSQRDPVALQRKLPAIDRHLCLAAFRLLLFCDFDGCIVFLFETSTFFELLDDIARPPAFPFLIVVIISATLLRICCTNSRPWGRWSPYL